MRSISATLKTAQYAASRTQYIHMVFTSYDGNTTYDFSSDSAAYGDRVLLIDHSEEAYRGGATIILKNRPRDIPDMLGYWTEIGYGDVTGSGNEYIGDGTSEGPTPRLWVKHQQFVSAGGRLLCVLELEDGWMKLRETLLRIGNPPYYIARNLNADTSEDVGEYDLGGVTIYAIISHILSIIDPAMTLKALGEDDGIMDTLIPFFDINATQPFEDAGQVIYRLIKMTFSFLRPKPNMEWEIKYPQEDDPDDLTYRSSASPKFYEYTERKNLLTPNRILVFANAGLDELYREIIAAQADDEDSQDAYGVVADIELAPHIDNQTDADTRAQAILQRWRAEWLGGRLIIKHDCQMELYDRLAIFDTRGF